MARRGSTKEPPGWRSAWLLLFLLSVGGNGALAEHSENVHISGVSTDGMLIASNS